MLNMRCNEGEDLRELHEVRAMDDGIETWRGGREINAEEDDRRQLRLISEQLTVSYM